MENDNLKLEEKPNVLIRNSAKPTGGFDGNQVERPGYECVPYAPASFPPNTATSNAGIHHFSPDQMPTTSIDRIIYSSHLNVSPTSNIELDSFGNIRNALPQQRSSSRIWTSDTNMNHSHAKGLPCRNIVKPRSTQNLTALAAFPIHTPINEVNADSTNVSLDAFQLDHPDQFGSFLTLGGAGNISDRFENLDVFGRDVSICSGSAALFQSNSTCFQTASGTSMGCMNLSHNNASRVQALHQELSGWNFASNAPTISSNSYVNSSPLSVFQRIPHGGPEGVFNKTPGNPAAPLGGNQLGLLNTQRNRANDLSMASLFRSPNTRLTSLQQNQAGPGSNQFQPVDYGKTRGKNLSRASLLGRHNTQLTSVQQSNEAGSAWNSSSVTSVFPCSPSFKVLESMFNDDHSVGVESRTGQSSHGVCRPSLKRGAIQPPQLAPRAQRHRQVVQLPSQLSNPAATINRSQPVAESGRFLASSSQIYSHNSAVHQMFRQPVPTFGQTARPYSPPVPSLSSRPKSVHFPSPLPVKSSAHRVKWEVSDESRPVGKKCFLCKRDVSLEPGGGAAKPKNPPPVAVLPCGHVFHDQCLEATTTPGEQSADPPCIPCAVGETPL